MAIIEDGDRFYGIRGPRMATVSGYRLQGLGDAAADAASDAGWYDDESTTGVEFSAEAIAQDQAYWDAMGIDNIGSYDVFALENPQQYAAEMAYLDSLGTDLTAYERGVPVLEAGGGGDAPPANAPAAAEAAVKTGATPNQVAKAAATVKANEKEPGFWVAVSGTATAIATVLGVSLQGLTASIIYKQAKEGKRIPPQCLTGGAAAGATSFAPSAACLGALAADGYAAAGGYGALPADPLSLEAQQFRLASIRGAKTAAQIDAIVNTAIAQGVSGQMLTDLQTAAAAAKAKLGTSNALLYGGIGLAAVLLLVAVSRRK